MEPPADWDRNGVLGLRRRQEEGDTVKSKNKTRQVRRWHRILFCCNWNLNSNDHCHKFLN